MGPSPLGLPTFSHTQDPLREQPPSEKSSSSDEAGRLGARRTSAFPGAGGRSGHRFRAPAPPQTLGRHRCCSPSGTSGTHTHILCPGSQPQKGSFSLTAEGTGQLYFPASLPGMRAERDQTVSKEDTSPPARCPAVPERLQPVERVSLPLRGSLAEPQTWAPSWGWPCPASPRRGGPRAAPLPLLASSCL